MPDEQIFELQTTVKLFVKDSKDSCIHWLKNEGNEVHFEA